MNRFHALASVVTVSGLVLSGAALAQNIASAQNVASSFCVAVNGGFGSGGTSYIAPAFTLPAKNNCAAWSGFTKTATTVIPISTGTGCLASDGRVLTLSIFNTDPVFFGAGAAVLNQIQLCPNGVTGCPITGQDVGNFAGPAVQQPCTASLLTLPPTHD